MSHIHMVGYQGEFTKLSHITAVLTTSSLRATVWAPLKNGSNGAKLKNGFERKLDVAAWTAGTVLSTNGETDQKLEVEYFMGHGRLSTRKVGIFHASELHVRTANANEEPPPEDVTSLYNLSEPEVLDCLARRYQLGQIYTSISDILIAVNPFKPLPHLFGPEQLLSYTETTCSTLASLPPHVFKSAAQAYRNLKETGRPQAILITGESGAGKTETAKCILCLLSSISSCNKGDERSEGPSIEMKLLDTNPLLEAFGNAKTVRNNNSSRFGKFIELQFGPGSSERPGSSEGSLILRGALVRTYLLELSRVVYANEGERSFHIFYQMVAGASEEERDRWSLKSLPPFEDSTVEGIDDVAEFKATRAAMSNIGIGSDESEQVFRALSAILHLRSVTFEEDRDGEGSIVSPSDRSRHHIEIAASLLGLYPADLRKAITTKTIQTSDGAIEMKLRPTEAKQSCDSLSKSIYSEIFDWIITRINHSLLPSSLSQASGAFESGKTIGILDIYGFESLAFNDLEQLCINLTNEKLQQHFNSHVLSWEQREYEAEGIEWAQVPWIDNSDIIDLIEGKRVQSVMNLLDEAAKLPKTTPQELTLQVGPRAHRAPSPCQLTLTTPKLASSPFIKASGRFSQPSSGQSFDARCAFELEHYAGTVTYQTTHMNMKNREASGAGATERDLLSNSSNPLLQTIFSRASNATSASPLSSSGSVVSRFRLQLSKMMELIRGCSPHFIRCIKPNPSGLPMTFDAPYALKQLRCGGIMEAVRIARAGFLFKQTHASFLTRFWPLGPTRLTTDAMAITAAEQLLASAFVSLEGEQGGKWAVGTSKVYLKADLAAHLEKRLSCLLYESSSRIQASWKGYLQRGRFSSLRAAALFVQTSYRARAARRVCRERREERKRQAAATLLQAHWRGRKGRMFASRLLLMHRAAAVIQRRWRSSRGSGCPLRGERLRQVVLVAVEMDRAARILQGSWRGLKARRELSRLRASALRDRFNQRIKAFSSQSQGGDVSLSSGSRCDVSRVVRSSGGAKKGCDQLLLVNQQGVGVALAPVVDKCSERLLVTRDIRDQDGADDVGVSLQWVVKGGRWVKRSNRDRVY